MSKYSDSYNSERRNHRNGRNYMGKCDVRLDHTELRMLRHLSNAHGVTNSDIMRRALRDYFEYCTDDEVNLYEND